MQQCTYLDAYLAVNVYIERNFVCRSNYGCHDRPDCCMSHCRRIIYMIYTDLRMIVHRNRDVTTT